MGFIENLEREFLIEDGFFFKLHFRDFDDVAAERALDSYIGEELERAKKGDARSE